MKCNCQGSCEVLPDSFFSAARAARSFATAATAALARVIVIVVYVFRFAMLGPSDRIDFYAPVFESIQCFGQRRVRLIAVTFGRAASYDEESSRPVQPCQTQNPLRTCWLAKGRNLHRFSSSVRYCCQTAA